MQNLEDLIIADPSCINQQNILIFATVGEEETAPFIAAGFVEIKRAGTMVKMKLSESRWNGEKFECFPRLSELLKSDEWIIKENCLGQFEVYQNLEQFRRKQWHK